MTTNQAILKLAPDFTLHREGLTAVDVIANLKESHGLNMRSYATLHANCIAVGASGSATFEIMIWSPKAGKFISLATPVTVTVAAGSAKAISAPVEGRIAIVACTAFASLTAAHVEVAAFWIDPRYD